MLGCALAVGVGVGVVVSSTDDGRIRAAPTSSRAPATVLAPTAPPSTAAPVTTRAPVPPATVLSEVDDTQLRAFVSAAHTALAQPWDQCTNQERSFSIGVPTGWFVGTPYPRTAEEWAARGTSLPALACFAFHFAPFSIEWGSDSSAVAAIHAGPGGFGSDTTFESLVDPIRVGNATGFLRYEARSEPVIDGRRAVCWVGVAQTEGLVQIPGAYVAGCYVELDRPVLGAPVFRVSVSVNPPFRTSRFADPALRGQGTVAVGDVPREARELVIALLDRLVRSLDID